MKSKGTSFGEIMIVFLIISVALIVFLKITSDYLKSLVFVKEFFILNSLLQSKYQLLIAYRNKALERPFGVETVEPAIWPNFTNNFCIDFNISTGKINVNSGSNCEFKLINGLRLNYATYTINSTSFNDYYIFSISAYDRLRGISSEIKNIYITKWHPAF
ncbi:MAG: hypothetical protein RQ894_01380 [Candidatus Pacebacteria bacterium]|nr:hypothetical protein [Candidatus Paceibacterota bacterium]